MDKSRGRFSQLGALRPLSFFYKKTEEQAGSFNGYYDMPVLTEAELSAFLSQAEQPDQLPQITGWSKEDKIPIKGEVREAVSGTLWKIAVW